MASEAATLAAFAIPAGGGVGGSAAGHLYVARALLPYACEGLRPLDGAALFAIGHVSVIAPGEPFLRKRWRTVEGAEFESRHCCCCAVRLEREAREAEVERTSKRRARANQR